MSQKYFELTNPQKSIWLTEQFYKGQNINNICGTTSISTPINFDKLKEAINIFIKDNDSFRIHLKLDKDGNVKQYFKDYAPYNFEVVELATHKDLAQLEAKIVSNHFNMLDSDLFTITLFKYPNSTGGFITNANHIIVDACTAGLVASKVTNIYSSLINGKDNPEASTSYINYMDSENSYLSSDKFLKDKTYWEKQFSDFPEIGIIPTVKTSSVDSSSAERSLFKLEKNKVQEINDFCKESKVSIFNFFMAIYAIYISSVSNLDNFVLGTPILNRTTAVEKNTPGMFISTVPFKFNVNESLSFGDFISNIAKDTLNMFRHQKYPYQNILEFMRSKDPNQPNLYDILISYQNTRTNRNSSDIPYEVNWNFNNNVADSLQIHIFDMNDEGNLNIAYDYRLNKYDCSDIEKIHERILNIIEQVIKNSEIKLKDVEIVTPSEKDMLLNTFNKTYHKYNKNLTVVDLFERQALFNPFKVALVSNNVSLTYKQLNEYSNILAHYLKERIGVNNNDIIGIMLTRSPEMIIGLLAILKCGAAYLPIDPDYPKERISYMLENSNTKAVLVNDITEEYVSADYYKLNISLNVSLYETTKNRNNLKIDINPNNLAYLIYTSGSTGRPKGVMIKHSNLHNFIIGMKRNIDFNKNKVMVSLTTICFDIFGLELWCSLSSGMTFVLANEQEQNMSEQLNKLCLDNHVNMIQTTPSRYSILLSDKENISFFDTMTDILVGGEALPQKLITRFQEVSNANIYNMYGPTETTIWSTMKKITSAENISIGTPITNTQCYILDRNQKILPPYVAGELYIGGDGVSAGYLHKSKLTEDKFVKSPFIEGQRIYNTNDLAYYTSNGDIIHLGRTDFQVKIRGYRIELGEIENQIMKFSHQIHECVVSPVFDRQKLCAYYTGDETLVVSTVQKYLQGKIPSYMVPNYFVKLNSFPHTPNGKIDRKSLPLPNIKSSKDLIIPRNDIDSYLVDYLEKSLHIDKISISDSFFEISGDSLVAISLCLNVSAKFNIQLNISDIYSKPIISDLSDLIASKSINNALTQISHVKSKEYYDVSAAQRRIYYASKKAGESSTLYNMPGAIIFDKKPNIKKLNECFQKLVERHASLRTYFEIINNNLYQKVLPTCYFSINEFIEKNKNIDEVFSDFVKPFDLSKAPLLRASFVELSEGYALLFDIHHIVCDGQSLSILTKELCDLYNDVELSPLLFNYTDFSEMENKRLLSDNLKESKDFWVNQFKDNVPILDLPTDFVRPAVQSFNGAKFYTNIPQNLTKKLNNLSKNLSVSNYIFLLSCYYILLYKYSNQEDIVVGTPVIGRNDINLLNIIGMFVNSLPLQCHLDNSMTFHELLNNVKSVFINSVKHQDYPFDELINDLKFSRDVSHSPLFDTMFIYQSNGVSPLTFDRLGATYYIPDTKISKYDLSLEITPLSNDKLQLSFEYCTDLFKNSTINNLAKHYLNILQQIIDNIDIPLKDIEIATKNEKEIILNKFNNDKLKYDSSVTLCNLIEKQCKKTPDYTAVVFGGKSITYKELNEKANCLARYMQSLGIKNDDIVGIMLPRSLEVLVCILAVWKCGACYIPIDPTFPKKRIQYMLQNSNAKLLLCFENNLNFENVLNVSFENEKIYTGNCSNLNNKVSPLSASYIIYTSGSTGNPKGVILNNKALSNLTAYLNTYVDYLKNDYGNMAIASITTISFDIFIFESLISLQKGLKVIMANENEQVTPRLLDELIYKYNIKAIQMTPSRLQIFIDNRQEMSHLSNLKYITLAGEALPDKLLKEILKLGDITVYNGYGPSETTVFATFTDVTNYKKINIGKPVPNTQIYILDKNKNICPVGIPGELYISGDGVGIGYMNNPDITKEKFLPDCFNTGQIFYKSGDLGKYLSNGEISYIGRVDNQIKIRGLRIELEEIENLIIKFPGILKAIVTSKEDTNSRTFLVAYLIVKESILTADLRSYLSSNLPRYMVPSYFMILDEFPYLPNGKINKKALPIPDFSVFANTINYQAPTNQLEENITLIFQKILNLPQVSINDNFFDLGGDSLLAMTLHIELMQLSNNINYSDIFLYPTVKELANKINKDVKLLKSYSSDTDFSEFDNILEKNNIISEKIKKSDCKNIFLTGVTGFLGAHILDSYMKEYPFGKVYCLVRKDTGLSLEEKVLEKLHFYFNDKYDRQIGKQIILIKGDISKPNLGINDSVLEEISKDFSHVINTAANVAHYGNVDSFSKINVVGTRNIVELCKRFNKKLYHISTTSVSGNGFATGSYIKQNFNNEIIFKENNFYINQSLDNLYVRSKFDAEKIVLSSINNGLDGYILRVGNLMARSNDTKFQKNVTKNAYINRLLTFVKLKCIPDYLTDTYTEFTPVDLCANSIIKLIQYPTKNNRIFHLYNHNHILVKELLNILNSYAKIDIISNEDFIKKINKVLKSPNSKDILSGILGDFGTDKILDYSSNIKINSDFTIDYLKQIGFTWPVLPNKYFIEFFKKILKGE